MHKRKQDSLWTITANDYPEEGTSGERLTFLAQYAVLAPSYRNAQAWKIRVVGDELWLHMDRARAFPIADPDNHQVLLDCGAALHNFRVAMRRFGHAGEIALFPEPGDPDLIARIGLGGDVHPSDADLARFAAITRRRPHRPSLRDRAVSSELVDQLCGAARHQGGWLIDLHDEDRRELLSLAVRARRTQFHDRRFRVELARLLRARARDEGATDLRSRALVHLLEEMDLGWIMALSDRMRLSQSPLLAILGTDGDQRLDWIRAGGAYQAVALEGTSLGLTVARYSPLIDVPEVRARVAVLAQSSGHPQLVLHLGRRRARPQPRRPMRDVLRVIAAEELIPEPVAFSREGDASAAGATPYWEPTGRGVR